MYVLSAPGPRASILRADFHDAGCRWSVLEAGGANCGSGRSIGIEPVFSGSHYRGAIEGRAFGWGGSTSRWGGLLVPHSDLDTSHAGDHESTIWKHIVQVVGERSGAVFAALGLSGRPDFFSFPAKVLGDKARLLRERGLATVAAEFLPFTRRNLTYLISGRARGSVRVFLHAVVVQVARWIGSGRQMWAVSRRPPPGRDVCACRPPSL